MPFALCDLNENPCWRAGTNLVLLDDAVLVIRWRGVPGDAYGSAVLVSNGQNCYLLRRGTGSWKKRCKYRCQKSNTLSISYGKENQNRNKDAHTRHRFLFAMIFYKDNPGDRSLPWSFIRGGFTEKVEHIRYCYNLSLIHHIDLIYHPCLQLGRFAQKILVLICRIMAWHSQASTLSHTKTLALTRVAHGSMRI